jgi:hypothetical protein
MKKTLFLSVIFFAVAGVLPAADIEYRSYAEREADLTDIKNELQAAYMREWIDATRGENVALGKPITASIKANYPYAPNNRLENLVDGKLSKNENGKLLFTPEAFGWTCEGNIANFPRGIWFMLDLQAVYPIQTIAMRVMGGWSTVSQQVPGRIQVLASTDGRDFYEIDTFQKLGPNEADAADGRRLVYIEEKGNSFVYPVRFTGLRSKARFLVFQISHANSVFSDEIAVIKGDFDPEEVSFPIERKRIFIREGLAFYPNKNVLAVSTNIITPNFFDLDDARVGGGSRGKPVVYCLELPPNLEILENNSKIKISVETLPCGRKKWSLQNAQYFLGARIGPIYFQVKGNSTPDIAETAVFYAECDDEQPIRIEVPIKYIEIPRAAPMRKLHVSLAWMNGQDRLGWPSFLQAYTHMGFNAVPTFPYHYMGKVIKPRIDKQEELLFLESARQHKLEVIMVDPTFHLIFNAATAEKKDEIFSQLEDADTQNRTNRSALCPAYRGQFYQAEIERFAEAVNTVRPDIIFHDIECYGWGCRFAPKCKTCLDYKEKLGIADMDEFIFSMGREHMSDLRQAVLEQPNAVNPYPPSGIYGLKADKPLGADWNPHAWEKLNDLLAFSQPSLYTGGNILKIHEVLSKEFKAVGRRIAIPWLTTGCPVEFDPRKIEPMLYVAFLDGVAGITYFPIFDFDSPLDFYYHAKAVATLSPYEDLLASGSIASVNCDNKALLTCAWFNPQQGAALVLLYNHISHRTEQARWSLTELHPAAKVTNVLTGKNIPATDKPIALAPSEFLLCTVEQPTGLRKLFWKIKP